MNHDWYFQDQDSIEGPVTSAQLKQLAAAGLVTPVTLVQQGSSGKWVPASRIQGLFPKKADHGIATRSDTTISTMRVECPFCNELIVDTARKCKHCGEILDPVWRAMEEARLSQPTTQIYVAGGEANATSLAGAESKSRSNDGCSGCGCLVLVIVALITSSAIAASL